MTRRTGLHQEKKHMYMHNERNGTDSQDNKLTSENRVNELIRAINQYNAK